MGAEPDSSPTSEASGAGALRQLAKHSSVYAVGTLLTRLTSFLLLPFYTVYLSPFDYGVLDIVETTSAMVAMVCGFGMAAALGRFYYDFDDAHTRNTAVSTAFGLAVLAGAGLLLLAVPLSRPITALLFGQTVSSLVLLIAFATMAVGLVIDLSNIYLRLINRSTLFVAVSLANLIIGVGLNLYFLAGLKLGVVGILYSNLLTRLLVGWPLVIWIWKRVGARFDRKLASNMYRYGLPLMPAEIASVVIGYSDRYFINGFVSTAATGIYGMAQKLGTALHYLITSPFLTAFVTQRFEIGRALDGPITLASIFKYHMVVLVVSSALLALFAPEILHLMTAPKFQEAAPLLPLAALSMVILATKYHFEYGILREKKTKYHLYINSGSALLHIALNFLLIRWIGVWGALIAVLVAYSSKSVGYLVVSQRLFRVPYPLRAFSLLLTLSFGVSIGASLILPLSRIAFLIKGLLSLLLVAIPFLVGMLTIGEVRKMSVLIRMRVKGSLR